MTADGRGILVVGAGAVGTVIAARLASSGRAVRIAVRPSQVAALSADGLRVEGPRPIHVRVDVRSSNDPLGEPEAVLLAVKTFDLAEAAGRIASLGPTPALLIQNGLDVEAIARSGAAGAIDVPWVRAVTSLPATLLAPGHARETGEGHFVLPAHPAEPREDATRLWGELLEGAGFSVRRAADFPREVWRKLLVNAAINPVTALHGVENGQLAVSPWREQALDLLSEARSVAAAEGVEFSVAESEHELFQVVRATAANRSSMLQDLERGRPMELDAILGAILERGARHGLDLPRTRRVLERLRDPTLGSRAATLRRQAS